MPNLSDYIALQSGIPESPTDGFTYGRRGQDGSWQRVLSKSESDADYAPIVHTHPYVGLTGNETIGGQKRFTENVSIGVPYNASYGIDCAGSINVGSGSNFFVNGSPIEVFVEAPQDGEVYGRQNAGWVLISIDGGTISNLGANYFTNYVVITNSGGVDATLNAATTSLAGVMSDTDKVKLDAAITAANLSLAKTTTDNTISNDAGTGVALTPATASVAGLLSAADKVALDAKDADLLGGLAATQFLRSDVSDIKTSGNLRFNDAVRCSFGNSDDSGIYHSGSTTFFDLATAGQLRITDANVTRFTFDDSGWFTATNDVTAFSDERLKKNISPIMNALDTIRAIEGVNYTRKDDPTQRQRVGVIAQQIEPYLPEVVRCSDEGILSVDRKSVV